MQWVLPQSHHLCNTSYSRLVILVGYIFQLSALDFLFLFLFSPIFSFEKRVQWLQVPTDTPTPMRHWHWPLCTASCESNWSSMPNYSYYTKYTCFNCKNLEKNTNEFFDKLHSHVIAGLIQKRRMVPLGWSLSMIYSVSHLIQLVISYHIPRFFQGFDIPQNTSIRPKWGVTF